VTLIPRGDVKMDLSTLLAIAATAIAAISVILQLLDSKFLRQVFKRKPGSPTNNKWIAYVNFVVLVGIIVFLVFKFLPSPPPTLLAGTTNWSQGLNGWITGSSLSQWNQSGGLLTSDGSKACCGMNDLAIWAPYTNLPNDYTVEAEIREKGVNDQQPLAPGAQGRLVYFGVLIRASLLTNDGYSVQIVGPTTSFVNVVFNTPSASSPDILRMSVKNKVLKDDWHTYRIEIKGSSFTVKIDNEFIFTINDSTFARGPAVGLWDSGGQLEVRSFKVYGIAP
jgi:hypothetical protein